MTLALVLLLVGTALVYGGWNDLSIRSLIGGSNTASANRQVK